MKFHIVTTLVDNNGQSPNSGVVNLYKNRDGKLVTGKKAYADETQATRKRRAPAGWTFQRMVPVSAYQAIMPQIEAVARKAAVQAADRWLAGEPVEAGPPCNIDTAIETAQKPLTVPQMRSLVAKADKLKAKIASDKLRAKVAKKKISKKK